MRKKVFHGELSPGELANALVAEFNGGGLVAQRVGEGDRIAVQVATNRRRRSGGRTAMTIVLTNHEDGVVVSIGQQEWLGIAASLGKTALKVARNPWDIINRLDDVAADINSIQLEKRIWQVIDHVTSNAKVSTQISERLRTVACAYCDYANEVGSGACDACGAPMGSQQPVSCMKCGFVNAVGTSYCANCGDHLPV